jgi:hypothetical protein
MSKPSFSIRTRHGLNRVGNPGLKGFDHPSCALSNPGCQLGPPCCNRLELRGRRWQELPLGPLGLAQVPNGLATRQRALVQEHHLAWPEVRDDHLLHEDLKDLAMNTAFHLQTTEKTGHRQGPQETDTLPFAARRIRDRPGTPGVYPSLRLMPVTQPISSSASPSAARRVVRSSSNGWRAAVTSARGCSAARFVFLAGEPGPLQGAADGRLTHRNPHLACHPIPSRIVRPIGLRVQPALEQVAPRVINGRRLAIRRGFRLNSAGFPPVFPLPFDRTATHLKTGRDLGIRSLPHFLPLHNPLASIIRSGSHPVTSWHVG